MAGQWPQSLDYYQAVQTPAHSFADADLKAAEVAVNNLGLPEACAGNFADVYQFKSRDGRRSWAVKCFTRPVQRLAERYREISRHLERARLPLAVAFIYLDEGIRIQNHWYPVLKMDWVEGQTLRHFVQTHLNKPRILGQLFDLWRKVEVWLTDAQIAHGDLQHGNILLVPGMRNDQVSLRLVDYDGMWVPGLAGQPAGEFGHPAYQHPQRLQEKVYTPAIDRFSNLVIGCALRCLSWPEGPQWWQHYDNGDNLLFTQSDFESPEKSQLLHELWESGNEELQTWAGQIAIASRTSLDSGPLLSSLFSASEIVPLEPAAQSEARRLLGYRSQNQSLWAPIEAAIDAAGLDRDWLAQPINPVNLTQNLTLASTGKPLAEQENADETSLEELHVEPVVVKGHQSQRPAVKSASLAEDPRLEWLAEAVGAKKVTPDASAGLSRRPPAPPKRSPRRWQFGVVHVYGTLALAVAMMVVVGIGIAMLGPGTKSAGDAAETQSNATATDIAASLPLELKTALETLDNDPNDQEANLKAGRFYCLLKNDWAKGLPFLSRASHRELQQAAADDLQVPSMPDDQVSVADKWWDLADRAEGIARESLRSRAAHWYRLARPNTSGVALARIDQRLQDAAARVEAVQLKSDKPPSRSSDPPASAPATISKNLLKPVNNAESWSFYVAPGGAQGTLEIAEDSAVFKVSKVTDTDWHVQAIMHSLDLQDGRDYRLKLTMRALQARSLNFSVSINQPDWHSIGLNEALSLSGDFKSFEFKFRAHDVSEKNNRLCFALGGETGDVILKGMSLTEVPIPEKVPAAENDSSADISYEEVVQLMQSAQPIFDSHFDPAGDDWSRFTDKNYELGYGMNAYYIESRVPGRIWLGAPAPEPYSNVAIQVEARPASGAPEDGFGIFLKEPLGICIFVANDGLAHIKVPLALIGNRQRFDAIGSSHGGKGAKLPAGVFKDRLYNSLVAVCGEQGIKLFVNGHAACSVDASALKRDIFPTPAGVLLRQWTGLETGSRAEFRRFTVWQLPIRSQLELPVPTPNSAVAGSRPAEVTRELAMSTQSPDAGRMLRAMVKRQGRVPTGNDAGLAQIKRVIWQEEEFQPTYFGTLQTTETTLGDVASKLGKRRVGQLSGLAVHPDGRLAVAYGGGTSDLMALSYWNSRHPKTYDPVFQIEYAPTNFKDEQDKTKGREAREANGKFWFFSGDLAFDKEGVCYFGLGRCGPNGLFRVNRRGVGENGEAGKITRLAETNVTASVQIPFFDSDHAYLDEYNCVARYALAPPHSRDVWLSFEYEQLPGRPSGANLYRSAWLSSDRLFFVLLHVNTPSTKADFTPAILDLRTGALFGVAIAGLVPGTDPGPLELAADNKSVLRYDAPSKTIRQCKIDLGPLDKLAKSATVTAVPNLASAPEDKPASITPQAASELQSAAAKSLGVPVEITNSIGMKLRLIPAGTFRMGSPVTEKDHRSGEAEVDVTLSRAFYLGKTEVTQHEWETIMGTTPWKGQKYVRDGGSFPATYVTWQEAFEFCEKLSKRELNKRELNTAYRLPSEAEWEFACRAGTTTMYSFGDDESNIGEYVWFQGTTLPIREFYPHEVGSKKPNPFGLCDVHGNTWEWCADVFMPQLPGGADPLGTGDDSKRMSRGGGCSGPQHCRSAFRFARPPSDRAFDQGFRIARSRNPRDSSTASGRR